MEIIIKSKKGLTSSYSQQCSIIFRHHDEGIVTTPLGVDYKIISVHITYDEQRHKTLVFDVE